MDSLFHENVGISAWGLAIHEKSRLIAVSTNLQQVHLFGFATKYKPRPARPQPIDLQTLVGPEIYEELDVSPLSADDHRYNGYKFTYQMGIGAHNIPSIAFVSNATGDAELILTSDVLGNLVRPQAIYLLYPVNNSNYVLVESQIMGYEHK